MEDLSLKKCVPCMKGALPLKGEQLSALMANINPSWKLVDGHHIQRTFSFKDFKEALAFTNKVGEIAEKEGHHPDIFLSWGKVKIVLWTHKIDGLSESDFILAAKCDIVF